MDPDLATTQETPAFVDRRAPELYTETARARALAHALSPTERTLATAALRIVAEQWEHDASACSASLPSLSAAFTAQACEARALMERLEL